MTRLHCLLATAVAALLATTTPAAASVLAFHEVHKNLVNGTDGLNGAQGVAVSPDGADVYVTGENDDALARFRRDPATGALAFVEALRDGVGGVDGLAGARAIALSADGAYAYVAGYVDDALAVFSRDAATGALTLLQVKRDGTGGVNGLDGANGIALSPDGASLYVAGDVDNAVAVFSRDPVAGTVTFVQAVKDATTLAHARAVAVSPDGAQVYVAASGNDTLVVFARDAAGILTQAQVLQDNTDGVDGLDGVRAVTMSPDGGQVYVAGSIDDALAVFRRDPATGALAFVQLLSDNTPGVNGLNGAYAVLVSPDGRRAYAVGSVDDALAVFDRDPATGLLTFLEVYLDGVRGIDGLNDAQGLALSPDGKTIYATGFVDDAVAGFDMTCGDGLVQTNEQCDDGNAQGGDCCSSTCKFERAGSACAADDNPCTDDQCNAGGLCEHVANTAPCDDGAFCTVDDTCQAGSCQGTPRDCSASSDQCNDGLCDETAAACVSQPRLDGTPCDDGSLCTRTDTCQAGACAGTDPVACVARDQCHTAGTCDPATGVCSDPAQPDGSPCTDGNACTQADACQAGVCTGADPVVCPAPDQCHDAGTCDPATGACSAPAQADGSPCDDGNACTADDTCSAAACAGTPLPDRDGDGIFDLRDLCADISDPEQADADHDGIGDACQCTAPAPGHCLTGGGLKTTDCLLELNPTGPVIPDSKRSGVLGVLRCTDGDPACDLDGAADGTCMFGVAVCLANSDPRLPKCTPGGLQQFQVLSPNPERARSSMDRANAIALEQSLGALGLEVRRRGRVLAAARTASPTNLCGPLVRLTTPAPAVAGGRPVRRTLRLRSVATDRRVDIDRITLECHR